MVSAQYLEKNWPSLTQFGMEVHVDDFHAKLDYRDLDLHVIFKVMVTILFVVEMVFAQYLEK